MHSNLQILVASSADSRLQPELRDAFAGVPDVAPVFHFATEFHRAVELARNHQPDLALIEMTSDLNPLRHMVEELSVAAPDIAIAAVFRPEVFGHDISESAFLIEAIRAGARDFLRRPISSTDLGQLVQRLTRGTGKAARGVGKVVSFVSNKGGVGKSTLSTNVACALAQRFSEKVLLIDASLQMGVCSALLNLRPATSLSDCVREWERLDESLIRRLAASHACGLHVLAAPADAEEASQVTDAVMARVITLARRTYDYVIVDTFPMLDRVILTALDLSERAYLITENVVPTVLGAAKLVEVFDRLGFPAERQRVILNRFNSFGGLRVADVAARIKRPIDFVVPYQKKLVAAANLGEPYILKASAWWGFGKAIHQIIGDITEAKPLSGLARGEPPTNSPAQSKSTEAAP